jgi:hypothetical protein
VRFAVAGRVRSRACCEDVGDGCAAEGGGADRLDGERCGEESLACAQGDGVNDEPVLVDQAGLDQRAGEPHPALGEQVSAGALVLELRDGLGQVAGSDRCLVPVGGCE